MSVSSIHSSYRACVHRSEKPSNSIVELLMKGERSADTQFQDVTKFEIEKCREPQIP